MSREIKEGRGGEMGRTRIALALELRIDLTSSFVTIVHLPSTRKTKKQRYHQRISQSASSATLSSERIPTHAAKT